MLLLCAAALVIAVGFPVRRRLARSVAALAVLGAVWLVTRDASSEFGVTVVLAHDDVAKLSWWLVVPQAAAVVSAAALVLGRGPAAQRGT